LYKISEKYQLINLAFLLFTVAVNATVSTIILDSIFGIYAVWQKCHHF